LASFIQKIKARYGRRRRSAVASVIGGVIVFAILFTVGYAYFLTAQQDYKSIQNSSSAANQEIFSVTGSLATGNVSVYIKNSGPITITIETIITVNQTAGSGFGKTYVLDNDSTNPSLNYHKQMPFSLNTQTTSKLINTTVPLGQSTFLIEAITARGTIATATISDTPSPASELALQALSSGSLGDIYISFNSFTYFTVTDSCGSSSKYCLGSSGSGFDIPAGIGNIALAVTVTDLNAQQASIVLDQFTLIYQNSFYGNNHQNFIAWYIISNQSNYISKSYTPIILPYDVPTTVVFASANCVNAAAGPNDCGGSFFTPVSSPSAANTISANLIISHGWELQPPISLNSLSYSTSNYGQDSPYVSSLYT
jgi:hypothetical protein